MRSQTDEQLAAQWDPEPWHHPDNVASRSPFNIHDRWVLDPRPECIPSGYRVPNMRKPRPPVNPILVTFRLWDSPQNRAEFIREIQQLAEDPAAPLILTDGYTMEHLDHARKVLTRLAALA